MSGPICPDCQGEAGNHFQGCPAKRAEDALTVDLLLQVERSPLLAGDKARLSVEIQNIFRAPRTREVVESDASICQQIRILGFGSALQDALDALLKEARQTALDRARRVNADRS